MSESAISAPIRVVIFCEMNATHLTAQLQELGYEPLFCSSDQRQCVRARKSIKTLAVHDMFIVGQIVSLRLLGLIDFAEHLGFTPKRI